MAGNAGKGSARRPTQVDTQTADDNFERIFGKRPIKSGFQPLSPEKQSELLNTGVLRTNPLNGCIDICSD